VQSCSTGVVLAKEQPSKFTVCGSSIPDGPATCQNGDPATEGTFNVLLPDLTKTPGDVYPTPAHMEIVDPSGDGVIEPGETFGIKIALLNAGSKTLTGVTGTLTSPPADLTNDGVDNPESVNITSGVSTYPDLAGLPLPSGDCSHLTAPAAVSNATSFTISIPATHSSDVGRPFNLKIAGTIAATSTPFQMDVPLVLGIGSSCTPTLLDGRFDGVIGLANPMAKLVRPGDVVPYATSQQGKVRPLKLQVLCGALTLNGDQIIPPQIAGLSRNGVALDIATLNLNDDSPNRFNPSFRWPTSGSNWIFNLNTKLLAKGTYVLTVRIGGDQDFVTGIVLN
jgi:hypothetical protein